MPFYFRKETSDEVVMEQVFTQQDYSLARLRLNDQINDFSQKQNQTGLRPLIIDLGANIGASVRWFLQSYPTSRVIAVEPDESNYELLERNTEGLDVICLKGAAASEKGLATLVDPGLGHFGFRTQVQDDGQLETFTVPELLQRFSGAEFYPFINKIDIEGAEEELFSKNHDWIDLFPVLIIELHDWLLPGKNSARNFLQSIAPRQRDFLYLGENVFSIRTPIA